MISTLSNHYLRPFEISSFLKRKLSAHKGVRYFAHDNVHVLHSLTCHEE
jgi:hypothetical protein